MSSDSGSGTINSHDETRGIEGAVDCDWVVIGHPGKKLNLKFVTEKTRSSDAAVEVSLCTVLTNEYDTKKRQHILFRRDVFID